MANDDDKPKLERGSYGDRGSLEQGRPNGLGTPGGSESVNTPSTQYDYSQRPRPRK